MGAAKTAPAGSKQQRRSGVAARQSIQSTTAKEPPEQAPVALSRSRRLVGEGSIVSWDARRAVGADAERTVRIDRTALIPAHSRAAYRPYTACSKPTVRHARSPDDGTNRPSWRPPQENDKGPGHRSPGPLPRPLSGLHRGWGSVACWSTSESRVNASDHKWNYPRSGATNTGARSDGRFRTRGALAWRTPSSRGPLAARRRLRNAGWAARTHTD